MRILAKWAVGAAALAAAAAHGEMRWEPTGPLMDSVTAIAVHPQDPSTVFASDMTCNLYRSTDAGERWIPLYAAPGDYLRVLAPSPSLVSDRTIFAAVAGKGISVSRNGGASWAPAGGEFAGREVVALAVSPAFADDRTVLAGMWQEGGIARSTDAGASWQGANAGLDTTYARWIDSIAFSPAFARDRTIFAGTRSGPYVSTNGGSSWRPANEGCRDRNVYGLAVSPSFEGDRTLFAGTDEGVYRSADAGARWTPVNEGISTLNLWQGGVAISPDFARDRTLFAGSFEGRIFKSTDAGERWRSVGPERLGMILRISLSPWYAADRTVYVSAGSSNIWKSTDGGETWREIAAGLGGCWSSLVALSPDYPRDGEVFLGTLAGVVRSRDRGAAWEKANGGLTNLSILDLDPSPAYASDGTLFAATREGIFRSDDRGGRWSDIGGGLPSVSNIFAVALSPAFASDATLYATVYRQGVFKSGDRGGTWARKSAGLANTALTKLALAPGFPADATIFAGTTAGIYRSADGGEGWSRAGALAGNVTALAVSPGFAEDRTVYAGIYNGGLHRSGDAGEHWEKVGGGLPDALVNWIGFAPREGSSPLVLAGTAAGVFRSADGGGTWEPENAGFGSAGAHIYGMAVSPGFACDGVLFASAAGNIYRGEEAAPSPLDPSPTPTQPPATSPTVVPAESPTPAPVPLASARSLVLEAFPEQAAPGGAVALSWRCDFGRWDYRGRPVDVWLAVLKGPRGQNGSLAVADALSAEAVRFFGPGLTGPGAAAAGPAFRGVVFGPGPCAGELRFAIPEAGVPAGEWVFAAALAESGTAAFVRDDGIPVEVSNPVAVR